MTIHGLHMFGRFLNPQKIKIPDPETCLPGRSVPLVVAEKHTVLGSSTTGPWPDMARIFDRSSADLYLFEPLQILRDCNRRGSWGRSEDIWRAHTQCVNMGHCGGCLDAMPVRKCTISGPGELVFKCVATGCGASTAP